MSLMSGISRFSWCRFSKSSKNLRREFQVTSLCDSLGPDKPNRCIFNNIPTTTSPQSAQRRRDPGSHPHLQRSSQQLCCRHGARSSRASDAPHFLRSRTGSLLPFSSLGRLISAPPGPFLPSCGKPQALDTPAAVPRAAASPPALSSSHFPTRTWLAGCPEHQLPRRLLPISQRRKSPAYAGSSKAQFQCLHPSDSPPARWNKQPLATVARPPHAPLSAVPQPGWSPGATGSTCPSHQPGGKGRHHLHGRTPQEEFPGKQECPRHGDGLIQL